MIAQKIREIGKNRQKILDFSPNLESEMTIFFLMEQTFLVSLEKCVFLQRENQKKARMTT